LQLFTHYYYYYYYYYCLLGCDTVSLGEWLLLFWRKVRSFILKGQTIKFSHVLWWLPAVLPMVCARNRTRSCRSTPSVSV